MQTDPRGGGGVQPAGEQCYSTPRSQRRGGGEWLSTPSLLKSWEIVKGRYGKPVLTPIWGTDVTESGSTDVVKPQILTAAEGHTLQKETILKASRPKDMNRDRFDEPVQHPVQGAKRTFPDQATVKERREMMQKNEVETDGSWRTVMNNSRNEKPIQIRELRTAVTESDCDEFKRRLPTVEADRLVDRNEEDKPGSGSTSRGNQNECYQ